MAHPNGREQEAKFQVIPAGQLQAVMADVAARLASTYTLLDLGAVAHTDRYFDTPTFALLRAGLALRLRQAPGQSYLGLKGLPSTVRAAMHDRLEIETPLAPTAQLPAWAEWPARLARRVEAAAGHKPDLAPIAVLRQVRHKYHIVAGAAPASPLAELSFDQVEVCSPADGETGGAALARLAEVEVEALAADAALHDLVARIATLEGLRPENTSKLERALAALSSHTPGGPADQMGIAPGMHAAEACRLIWRSQLAEILLREHGLRRGNEPEDVHKARVATRRARAAGRLFAAYFRKAALRPHMAGFKRLGQVLGEVRDLDVAWENLRRFRKTLPKGKRKGAKALETEMTARRQAARATLLAYLDSRGYEAFIAELDRFCRTPGEGVKPPDDGPEIAPSQVRHTLPSMIHTRFEQVRAYETLAAQPAPLPLPSIHALRIAGKNLRYSLEFGAHLLGEDGQALVEELKRFQDLLGSLNDAAVERTRLAGWQLARDAGPAIAARLADLDATIDSLVQRVPAELACFVTEPNRARLAAALARL
jgi:CHAD domain-containing protein